MTRRVPIDDAPFAFGIEGEHVAYQADEPIDERLADEAAATERQTRAAAFFWAFLARLRSDGHSCCRRFARWNLVPHTNESMIDYGLTRLGT
jgi:hypothetical protein